LRHLLWRVGELADRYFVLVLKVGKIDKLEVFLEERFAKLVITCLDSGPANDFGFDLDPARCSRFDAIGDYAISPPQFLRT
jgi:hypothetical protein